MKFLPSLVIAALAGLIVFFVQESRLNDLRDELSKKETSLEEVTAQNRTTTISKSASTPSPVTSTKSRDITETRPEEEEKEEKENPMRSMAKVFETDAGRAMLKQGIEASLPMFYGDFIESLDLNEEETKYFKGLLADKLLNQQQLGMKWMQADAETRLEVEAEMETLKKEDEAKIAEFLQSEEDTAALKQYEEQLPERQHMAGIRNALADEPLSPEKEERLVETLYQARLNSGEGNASEEENWQALAETGDFGSIQERWKQTDALIEKEVPTLLSEGQSEAFLEHWRTTREFQVTQYQMGMQMLGIKKK